jgi:flagellar biosynthesis protein FlhG
MRNSTLPRTSAASPRIISILSGKGGVGKSVIAFNLANELARQGAKVLLVDADFGCGNLHLLANVAAEFGIGEYASNQLTLREAVTTLTSGVDLLAATWHETLGEDRNIRFTAQLLQRLRSDARAYNFILFDHRSGRSNQTAMMAHASDLVLLVAIPELTSLSDAYGLYKHLLSLGNSVDCGLVVNRAQSDDEAQFIAQKFDALTERFLGRSISVLATIPEDETVRRSIAAQSPLAKIDSQATVCQAFTRFATVLVQASEFENSSLTTIRKDSVTADTRG